MARSRSMTKPVIGVGQHNVVDGDISMEDIGFNQGAMSVYRIVQTPQ